VTLRRSPLRSTKRLERKTPLRASSPSKRTAKPSKLTPAGSRSSKGPPRDPAFLAYVRRWPCVLCRRTGRTEPHHFGRHGTGTKCSDYEVTPLCTEHHRLWHDSGSLPGRERAAWLRRWFRAARLIHAAFERQKVTVP
jgi:hypothetical protein